MPDPIPDSDSALNTLQKSGRDSNFGPQHIGSASVQLAAHFLFPFPSPSFQPYPGQSGRTTGQEQDNS
jgi:hypothetical protein